MKEESRKASAAADAEIAGQADAGEALPVVAAPVAPRSDGITRRALCAGGISAAALIALGGLRYVGHNPLPRPPGGQNEAHLVDACIRCERCYEVCPRHVIVPAHIEDGLLGMRTPTFDFETNYCDFCTEENGGVPLCVQSCPTEALVLPEGATPETTIMGIATIDQYQCLAFRDSGCRYCYDACPYEAIEMRDNKPYIIADKCNGCGACESVCVSLKAGSIAAGATERAVVVRPVEN